MKKFYDFYQELSFQGFDYFKGINRIETPCLKSRA